jgi:hypothetical protein
MTKKNPDKGGRPTVITQDVVNKLEYAFGIGCSVNEACCHANISKQTYYNYTVKHPELLDRVELLREKMPLKAREVIQAALNDVDYNTAKWYLERKKKDEFSIHSTVESTNTTELTVAEQYPNLEGLSPEELDLLTELSKKAKGDNE